MTDETQEGESLREEDIRAFLGRLEEWGKSLPETEQALLRLLMARAEGSIPLQEELGPATGKGHYLPPLDVLVPSVLERLVRDLTADGDVWVKMGPIWLMRTPELSQ